MSSRGEYGRRFSGGRGAHPRHHTNFRTENEEKKRTQTSGLRRRACVRSIWEAVEESVALPKAEIATSGSYQMPQRDTTMPSLYLKPAPSWRDVQGKASLSAIPKIVGPPHAVDKIAGWIFIPRRRSRRQDHLQTRDGLTSENGHQEGEEGNPILV